MSEADETEDRPDGDETVQRNRLLRFARRLMDRREIAEDTRDLLLSLASTSDKAKTEAVKMVAREVRNYLEELKLKEDLRALMTGYSLEISLRLKPLPETSAAVKKE